MSKLLFRAGACLCAAIVLAGSGCDQQREKSPGSKPAQPGAGAAANAKPAGKKPQIAFVTNGIDPFWDIAAAGAQKAAADLGVNVRILMPPNGVGDQVRMVQEMITVGVDALAISPIDKVNENDLINEAAAKMPVITFDSDAPGSNRKLFLGVDNLRAGREVGKLVKEAAPDGGEVMIFIGRLDQLNAVQRTQGVIDELLGLPPGETAMDDPARNYTKQNLQAGNYTVLDVRTDQFDKARAKQVVEDALTRHPNIKCMVGLFAYNPPAILNVLRDANKLGQVKIVGFDEQDDTLQGIQDGQVHGTISQQPFNYGYESVRVCKALLDGDTSVIPKNGVIDMPLLVVKKDNVTKFWDDLKAALASVKKAD